VLAFHIVSRVCNAATLACVLLLTVAGVAAAQPPYDGIVVFGTSLSDPGNAFALRGGTNTPPDYELNPLLIPSSPYARGGHHFSNGGTWIEQFARTRGLAGSVQAAFRGDGQHGTNFAVAAARAYDDGVNLNLGAQVDAFLAMTGEAVSPRALYVVEIGGNDVRDALVAFASGGHLTVLQNALASIAFNLTRLYNAGARRFLVWTVPNPALTPAIRTLNAITPGTAQLATGLTQAFNAALNGVVAQLSAAPGIEIQRLDAFALLNELAASPGPFGLANVTSACVTPNTQPFSCARPDEFLFWDGLHPTAAVHSIIAQRAAAALGR
jgi:outer membrane lipase/esterase